MTSRYTPNYKLATRGKSNGSTGDDGQIHFRYGRSRDTVADRFASHDEAVRRLALQF